MTCYRSEFENAIKDNRRKQHGDIVGLNLYTKCSEYVKFYENVFDQCKRCYYSKNETFVPIVKISKSNFKMIDENRFNMVFDDIIQECNKHGVLFSKNSDILISFPFYRSTR